MSILLLGGTGYLGSNITKCLSNKGYHVFCVVRRTSDISYLKKIRNVHLISNDPGQIQLTLEQEKIDWVINSVTTYRPNEYLYGDMLESNVIFPLSVLNLAIKNKVKNYMTIGTGLPENFNVYSFTKAKFSDFGRFLSIKDGINFADLRLEMFYGGENEPDSRFMKACRLKMQNNETVDLTEGTQLRDLVRVEDILRIICKLIKSKYVKGYKVLPIGCGEQHSIREIMEFMKDSLKSESILNFGAVPYRDREPNTVADISWYKDLDIKLKYDFFTGLYKDI